MPNISKINYSQSLHKSKQSFAKSLIGMFIAVFGLGLGVLAISQPNLFSSRALVVRYASPTPILSNTCLLDRSCQAKPASGATRCKNISGLGYSYCCPEGLNLYKNVCRKIERCGGGGLDCVWQDNAPAGSRQCFDDYGGLAFCCPKGKVIRNNRCVILYGTPKPSSSARPVNCEAVWVNLKCGGGECLQGEREQARFLLPAECGKSTRCVFDPTCN